LIRTPQTRQKRVGMKTINWTNLKDPLELDEPHMIEVSDLFIEDDHADQIDQRFAVMALTDGLEGCGA